jgi:hypothetical protein
MITNTGKNILAKYLIGQAPAYASHIAIGCGAKAQEDEVTPGDYLTKKALDFEMFRVPIVSRGYVREAGVSKIVLTAELPTQERYEITEIGVFSAGYNPSAGNADSRTLLSFSQSENWEYKKGANATGISLVTAPLDATNETGKIEQPELVFRTNATNKTFSATERAARLERCRFLDNMLMIRGDTSKFSSGTIIDTDSDHIRLRGTSLDLTRNSPADQIKLAFSVINTNVEHDDVPNSVNLLVEFANATGTSSARMFVNVNNDLTPASDTEHNFDTTGVNTGDRYVVVTKTISDLEVINSAGFAWSDVSVVKIYSAVVEQVAITNVALTSNFATITTSAEHGFTVGQKVVVDASNNVFDGTYVVTEVPASNTFKYAKTNTNVTSAAATGTATGPSSKFYVAVDALRLENVSSDNPLYGLTGYSVVQVNGARPIVKSANTANLVEFRFAMDVG